MPAIPSFRRSHRRARSPRCRSTALVVALVVVLGALTGVGTGQAATGTVRVDLEVLVLTDRSVSVTALADALRREGVPYTEVDLTSGSRPTIDAAFLSETTAALRRGRYQAVIVPEAAPPALTVEEAAALRTYQVAFGVRQVDAYVWPTAAVGLQTPRHAGLLDGGTAEVTPEGRAQGFGYLDGGVPFDDGTFGYVASPVDGAAFTTLVSASVPGVAGGPGAFIGAYTHDDGREELVVTTAAGPHQLHWRALTHGIITWATKGVHLGTSRNYLSVHIDDVLLPDDRWHMEGDCTPGADCPVDAEGNERYTNEPIRMDASDVAFLRQWQDRTNLKLDLAFNAFGSVETTATGPDPLTDALLADRDEFRWINHTWSHPWLGCFQEGQPWRCSTDAEGNTSWVDQATIRDEISRNQAWAVANDVAMDPAELVTGQHSGIRVGAQQPVDNPNLAPALAATGVEVIATDNSREQDQRLIGGTITLPRYPMNIFYNVATEAEQVDEYNWIYTAEGSGLCHLPDSTCIEPLDLATGFDDHIVPLEAEIALRHVLGNDPRPHFVHQSNLAEDRILYPVLDHLLADYDGMYAANTPIVQPTMTEAAVVMARQAAWQELLDTDRDAVQAYTLDGVLRVETTRPSIDVPITAPMGTTLDGGAVAEVYGGEQSGWVQVTTRPSPTTVPETTTTTTAAPTTTTTTTAAPTTTTTLRPTPTTLPVPSEPARPARSGYWMVGAEGAVYAFGDARWMGNASLQGRIAVDIEATPDFTGYWIVDDRGTVHAFGTAQSYGDASGLAAGERVTSLSGTANGRGYWLTTDRGRSLAFGSASPFGDMSGSPLNGPVLDSIRTATGNGYYMVGSDGGIFSFGDATFHGSMGGRPLNAPVRSLGPDPDGHGYWLVADDGGVFAFDAAFRGSMGATRLNRPVVGMVPYGNGYLMVAADGGIFSFSDKPFVGSLGADPPAVPVVGVAALNEVAPG